MIFHNLGKLTYQSKCVSYLLEGDGHGCGRAVAPARKVSGRGRGSSLEWGRGLAPLARLTRPFDTR